MKKVKNFLGNVKEVKAPLKWKSSKDAPPTQLAYITRPEIDLLVKANLHGSMNGQPNVGPKGIMSLDGGGEEYTQKQIKAPKATKKKQKQFAEKVAAYQAQTGGSHQSAYEKNQASAAEKERFKKIREGKIKAKHTFGVSADSDDVEKSEEQVNKEEKKAKEQAELTAKELVAWWSNRSKEDDYTGYRSYGDRKGLFSDEIRNTEEKVIAKLKDKLNKGTYKIVEGPDDEPLIIHASTGTPVNPFTGHIISTQAVDDQGGAYQNRMAKSLGMDTNTAGVFSKEYQTGNGLAVANMKPQHALRFLMKKNRGAFEQFFNMNKDKAGFNPFSVSTIGTAMGTIMNMITGPEALQVGNNLERAGWGKAIKGDDGKYTIQLTKKGAKEWSNSFNWNTTKIDDKEFSGFVSPEAISKDKDKGYLSELLGTKKFPDQPIDLTNLIEQGGYQQGTGQTMGFAGSGLAPITQVEREQGFYPTDFKPVSPQSSIEGSPLYSYPADLREPSKISGTPPNFNITDKGIIQNYPQFTPEGYRIGAYNPSRTYGNQGVGGQGGGQGGGGGGGQNQDQDTTTQGPLTYDIYGRPVTYNYTGGPEQLYIGGGYKRDGQYIGSPYGFSKGGIANFKPYGY